MLATPNIVPLFALFISATARSYPLAHRDQADHSILYSRDLLSISGHGITQALGKRASSSLDDSTSNEAKPQVFKRSTALDGTAGTSDPTANKPGNQAKTEKKADDQGDKTEEHDNEKKEKLEEKIKKQELKIEELKKKLKKEEVKLTKLQQGDDKGVHDEGKLTNPPSKSQTEGKPDPKANGVKNPSPGANDENKLSNPPLESQAKGKPNPNGSKNQPTPVVELPHFYKAV
ncbi:hypothetical protein MJO28_006975 [Puccinia striiformis f. sp. tritici]|uniref:Secreted protein n=2 Tax=Puccinia striiformis TaxID=27350 RepID=A0A2S4VW91_9BASI|nr:hypothetical protein Pst134EB_014070 [Puccinia striiformis f. sp. tritici]KAI7951291.1 hypothetical protein MJO28_006975 [Puccinia striiformis f. sp. tritici]KAI7955535.1 hypothetical protein MJO29_006934 [Puccinia striiformis f. sp. tritici]POW13804.1 hypothetical protein PSTT_03501 [Puccinia striiformis]